MIVYKLFRKLKNNEITSLFINKKERLDYNIWYDAKPFPTKGYKFRPFWHCLETPDAPHLTEKNRVWLKVQIDEYEEYKRPKNQGGSWFLAKKMKILNNET